MESFQGKLLIASPSLIDPNFARTVVLVAVHGNDGALGLIVNRELNMSLKEVWIQVSDSPCLRDENARHGGPVGGTLMALHNHRPHANLVVTDDLYIATEIEAMTALAGSEDGQVLFYVGHSGWGPGQLENELEEGSWLVSPATPDHIFGDLDTIAFWKWAMTDSGRRQVQSLIPLRYFPDNPRVN